MRNSCMYLTLGICCTGVIGWDGGSDVNKTMLNTEYFPFSESDLA